MLLEDDSTVGMLTESVFFFFSVSFWILLAFKCFLNLDAKLFSGAHPMVTFSLFCFLLFIMDSNNWIGRSTANDNCLTFFFLFFKNDLLILKNESFSCVFLLVPAWSCFSRAKLPCFDVTPLSVCAFCKTSVIFLIFIITLLVEKSRVFSGVSVHLHLFCIIPKHSERALRSVVIKSLGALPD